MINNAIFTKQKKEELLKNIKNFEKNLKVKLSSSNQLTIILNSNNNNIAQILEFIDNYKDYYGIEDYTIGSTSLEDVFLRVNNLIYLNQNFNRNKNIQIKNISIEGNNILNENNINNNISSNNNIANENNINNNIINNNISLEENNSKNIINENNNNNILEIQNMELESSNSSFSQFLIHISRLFSGFWKMKSIQFLNYLYCIIYLYIYLIIHVTILNYQPVTKNNFDLINLLENNLIFTNDNNYLEKSSIYKKSIKFKKVNTQESMKNFTEEIYKKAYLNIGKSGIHINKQNENLTEIYNTEIPLNVSSYILANTMLSVSAFLKNEYNIDAVIFPEITFTQETLVDVNKVNGMLILGYVATFSYTTYITIILSEKIREKVNGLKHLIYLSGSNMISYWCSHILYDFIRFSILNLFMSIGIFFVSQASIYIFILFTVSTFSVIFFDYFLSEIFASEKMSQLALFFIYFFFLIIPNILGIIFEFNIQEILLNPNYTIYDIIPITAILKGCYSMTLSFFPEMIQANKRIIKSIIIQLINALIYLVLFILAEKKIINRVLNYIKIKYLIRDSNTILSSEKVNVQFLNDNYLSAEETNSLLQNYNQIKTLNNNNINLNLVETEKNKIMEDISENKIPTK